MKNFLIIIIIALTQSIYAQGTKHLWSNNDGSISIKVHFSGVDPGGAESFYFIVDNNTSNDMKVSFNYTFVLSEVSTDCPHKTGSYNKVIGANRTNNDGGYSGSISKAKMCSGGRATSVLSWGVANVRTENMSLPKINQLLSSANAKIKSRDFRAAQKYIDEASNLCNYCELQQSINTAQENLRDEKLAFEQEKFEKEQEKIRAKEEEERKEKERKEKEKEEEKKEQPKEEEKPSENQELTDEDKPDVKNEIEEIKEIEESETTTLKEQKEKKKKTKKEQDSEYNLYIYCQKQKDNVANLIQRARALNTLEAWEIVNSAYSNFTPTCGSTYILLPVEWKNEIDKNLMALTASEALIGTAQLLSSSPWNYGYGEFIDATNNNYIHRFGFGVSGSYEDKIASIDFSMYCNIMRLPTRTLNYTFESDNGTLWNAEKSRTIDNVKIFSISFGPSFTLWPQKNIFLQITPEVNVGFQNNGDETILKTFTLFPSLASKIGLRFGKVYLSGTYGLIFKKFEVDKSSPFAEETGSINGYNVGTVNGKWIADNFDNNEYVKHTYWLISIGLDL
jgi:hypothetical protein